ncbi:hypothetical protein VP395_08185 [Mariniflexile soesokkakense]|uniref:Uncharacterized protein n=1 Tax=Mariniflexile soesokkakense TaxID=1343160 RepID=A0ABV0A9B9_9FLAO
MENLESTKTENEELIQKLIKKVFEKAMELSKETTAYGLSKYLIEELNNNINQRTLIRYYDGYVLNKKTERRIPSTYNLDILCQYLGYKNNLDFIAINKKKEVNKVFNKKSKIASVSVMVLLASYIGYDVTNKDCMVWTNDNCYESISCDKKGDFESIPKNDYLLQNFKRIEPDCNYSFFKVDGVENLWYGKNINGELEYFTAYGLHPETSKTLKPITEYMINKYICPNLKKSQWSLKK